MVPQSGMIFLVNSDKKRWEIFDYLQTCYLTASLTNRLGMQIVIFWKWNAIFTRLLPGAPMSLHLPTFLLLVRRLRRGHRHPRRLQRAGHRDGHVVAPLGRWRRRRGGVQDLHGAAG